MHLLNNVNGAVDTASLLNQVEKVTKSLNLLPYTIGGYIVCFLWIASIVDAYYIGTKIKPSNLQSSEPTN